MIWPSNGRPKAKGIMMTDDSMMTVWVRKGLRREGQKYLSFSSLQTDYLNLDSSSGFGRNSEISNTVQKKCIFVVVLITLQNNVSKVSYSKRKETSCGW